MNRKKSRKLSLARTFSNDAIINTALTMSVAMAIDRHRRAGNKIKANIGSDPHNTLIDRYMRAR